jgi:F-type H+-transporting ATPase subunit alpha
MGNMINELATTQKTFDNILDGEINLNKIEESGTIVSVDSGIAVIKGLNRVKNEELIGFPGDIKGISYNLDSDSVGVILLGNYDHLQSGDKVSRTYEVAKIPVSDKFLGRIITPLGEILDEKGDIQSTEFYPIERKARPIMHRAPVVRPLQTGIKVIDSVVPVGKGQRELILGDRQTGKTAIGIDTIINQKDKNVICIYCSIGQQASSVAKAIETLRIHGAMDYTVIMVADPDDPPGVSYLAPYSAASLAEYFMEKGEDVLVIYDDLTKHARAYREISLLLERPPGREAYPGDIFFIHSKLLERSTQLRSEFGGGSFTALPIIETQGENLSAYIPTNLISITDGQIYLSPKLFQKGNMPAVKIGDSVSRVGGKTQLPSYRKVTSDLKLTYSQFEELEAFASFGTRLDESTQKTLERGRRIRGVLNQRENSPLDVTEQIGVLLSVTTGAFDIVPLDEIEEAEQIVKDLVKGDEIYQEGIFSEKGISDEKKQQFLNKVNEVINKKWG